MAGQAKTINRMSDCKEAPFKRTIWIINGPNIDKIGVRDKDHYGSVSYDQMAHLWHDHAKQRGVDLVCHQSPFEGQLIQWVHEAMGDPSAIGVIMNAGGYSHTSIALMDAVAMLKIPVIDVHVSNIHQRETYRHTSFIAKVATGAIAGFKGYGYVMAMDAIINHYF